jgi:hypothetical protein
MENRRVFLQCENSKNKTKPKKGGKEMPKKSHHVVPNSGGGWNIKKGGGTKTIKHTKTKKEAENIAREISINQKSELYIHGKDGKFQRRDSHGNDPHPPKG